MGFINSNLFRLNDEIMAFITDLVKCSQNIKEIWLIGSRANGKEEIDSDWDLLVFVVDDGKTLHTIKGKANLKEKALNRTGPIDLFINSANNIFVNPWRKAKLHLTEMNWQVWSPETSAEYDGEKGKEGASMVWAAGENL